jgi:hypothetical protein
VKWCEKYEIKLWNDLKNMEENSEKKAKIWKKIKKWYGKYRWKVGWIVKWYGKYGRKVSWIVKRYGKYGRKVSWILKWFGK